MQGERKRCLRNCLQAAREAKQHGGFSVIQAAPVSAPAGL